MNFRFSKTFIDDGLNSGGKLPKKIRLYKVFDDNNEIIAQFFYTLKEEYLKVRDLISV
ncbi:MAG: hypothetical protein WDO19_03295 [Bacteroidota bacterium]